MVRVSLTLWFAVSSLIGPGVCCCSWRHLPSAGFSNTASHNEATPPHRSCCGSDQSAKKSTDSSPPEKRAPERCPCKDWSAELAAIPCCDKTTGNEYVQGTFDGWQT